MTYVAVGARLVLAFILLAAVAGKLGRRRFGTFREFVRRSGCPRRSARSAARWTVTCT